MTRFCCSLLVDWSWRPVSVGLACVGLVAGMLSVAGAQDADPAAEEDQCIACHGNTDLWEGETLRLLVTPDHLAHDTHSLKGIKCQQCHGGNPNTINVREAHAEEDGFRTIATPADEPAFCGHCHANTEYLEGRGSKLRSDVIDRFWGSAHGKHLQATGGERAASCSSCHPYHQTRPASDPESSVHVAHLAQTCGKCHEQPLAQLTEGVHQHVGPKDPAGVGTILACTKCHTEDPHDTRSVKDSRSSMFLDHQIRVCGECHKKELEQYVISVHGTGLLKSGLSVTASCSDCHGGHNIFPRKDPRSRLHPTKVAKTCATCHRFIEERLQASVHGWGDSLDGLSDRVSPGGTSKQKPTCTSCHQGHDLPATGSLAFRNAAPDRCGECHTELRTQYGLSLHGQLADLGYGPAARCADCHGAHDIHKVTDPQSRVASGENRLATCQQCHPRANLNFARFNPHADHRNPTRHPFLHAVFLFMEILLISVFSFFGIHTALWLVRSLIHTMRHGRPKRLVPQAPAYQRFAPIHRILHGVVIVSFLGLALTGLPLKYSNQPWAQQLATALGGFGTTKVWHHLCGMITFGYFAVHLGWLASQIAKLRSQKVPWKTILLGPDSPVPNFRDLRELIAMFLWFFGIGVKPRFERWTYWEKFDYWAVFWGVGIIGLTGLVLWLPELFCRLMPGELINIAKVIHSEEALLATGFIFTIHFFNTHLRAEKFPMDMTMFTGMISDEEMAEERGDFMERMRREGKLEAIRSRVPNQRTMIILTILGAIALAVGILLLIGILSSFRA